MTEPTTIYIRGEGGGIHAMDLPLHESIQQRLASGQLTRVNQDGSPYAGVAEPSVATPPATRPVKTAPKSEWVGWAVTVHHMDAEKAEAMTKADLADLADQPAADQPAADQPAAEQPAADQPAAEQPDGAPGRPAEDAEKSEWIAYVVRSGKLSAEDATNYTKDDLIDLAT